MRIRLFVLIIAVLLMLAGCGGASTARTIPASLHVSAVRVKVTLYQSHVSRIPVNNLSRFVVMLTSTTGPGEPLQASLQGAPNSFPVETRNKPLQDAFPGCTVSAILYIDTSTPGINTVGPTERSLNDTEADWMVDVTPQSPGTLSISGEIDVKWTCSDGRFQQSQLTTFQQAITVFDPHPVHTLLDNIINNPIVVAVAGTLLASFLTWLIVLAGRRITKKQKYPAHKKSSGPHRKSTPDMSGESIHMPETSTPAHTLSQPREEEQEIDTFQQPT